MMNHLSFVCQCASAHRIGIARCIAAQIAVVAYFVCAGSASAQPQAAEKVLAVRAGKLVDVVAGKTLLDQIILIRGERISAVGPAALPPARSSNVPMR